VADIVSRNRAYNLAFRDSQVGDMLVSDTVDSSGVRDILAKLLRRKLQMLLVALIVFVPAAIATYLQTPLYRSTAILQVDADPVQILPYRDIMDMPSTAPYYEMYLKTQEQVLKSPVLAVRVAGRLDSKESPDQLRGEKPNLYARFKVRRVENSQLIELSYLAPDSKVAASVVNLFAEEYIKQLFITRQTMREKARTLLEGELRDLDRRVQASEQGLVRYASRNQITSVDSTKADLTEEKLAQLSGQLMDVEAELIVCKTKRRILEKASVNNLPEKLVTQGIISLSGQVLAAESGLTALETSFGKNWPEVIQKRNELSLLRNQLEREKSAVLSQAREQAEMDLLSVESRRDMIAAAIKKQHELVDQYRSVSIQYNFLRREVETNQKLYDGLLERLKQTSVTAGMDFSNIRVIEPGQPGATPYSPNIPWNLGIAGLMGLALGVCFALVRDFWDTSVSSIEEAEQISFLPALGSVPFVKQLKSGSTICIGNQLPQVSSSQLLLPKSQSATKPAADLEPDAAEDIRSICASILLSKSDQPPRVIMLTSATPGEGKTVLSASLAQALADAGNKTLLVEMDMRKPALMKALGIGNDGGLSLFLSGHINPMPKVHNTAIPNLFAVSSGPRPPNPVALLSSEKLTFFLKEMAASFQFILLDTPPILSFADARILGLKADGVILVVRADHTPKNLIRRATSMLDKLGVNILGMILNQASRSRLEASYYRYYRN
jgi:polysaccharide biosynthesis transport protein